MWISIAITVFFVRTCIAKLTDSKVELSGKPSNPPPECGFLKITSGTCEDSGLLSIPLNKECQGAIMDLGIKADFLLMEASQAPLHGCWLEESNDGLPIARVNKDGHKDAAGGYSQHYSNKKVGICKTKGCDEVDYEYLYYHYMSRLSDEQYCKTCSEKGYVLLRQNAACTSYDVELAPGKTCEVAECAKLCYDQEGCDYFIVGNGVYNGVDTTGRCFWEKASNGCKNGDDSSGNTLEYHPYNFYAVCRDGFHEHAEFQCTKPPAKINAGQCRKNPEIHKNHKITDKRYCNDCTQMGYVLLTENAECSGKDVELAPHKICSVEECAKLCLEKEGCNYFIVGNGKFRGLDKTGHCYWEKTNSACQGKGERFEFDAYDFYSICRATSHYFQNFQCKYLPKPIDAGQCKARTRETSEDQRLHCVACGRKGYVLIQENAQCSAGGGDHLDVDLAPGKVCSVDECAKLCLQRQGCHYFIVGNGVLNGVDKTGRCYWEKTSSGCEDIDERLHFDAYDFYSICRPGGQCENTAKIVGGQCKDVEKDDDDIPGSSMGLDMDTLSNADYCTECERVGYVLLTENAECSGEDEELAPHKICSVEECAKLCLEKEGCNYFIVGNGFTTEGVDKTGHCYWEKTRNGCKDESEKYEFDAYDFFALCRPGLQPEAEYQCQGQPKKLDAGKCRARQTRAVTFKEYCHFCEQEGYILLKENARCFGSEADLAPNKICTVQECAKMCFEQKGCDYFIVGNGAIRGIDKSGHCYWQKTSKGCNRQRDRFEPDAFDFYALCRAEYQPHAEFQCDSTPATLEAGKCRVMGERAIGNPSDSHYGEYYYRPPPNQKDGALRAGVTPFAAVANMASPSHPPPTNYSGITAAIIVVGLVIIAFVAGGVLVVVTRNRKKMELNIHHANGSGRDPSSNGHFENAAQSVVDDDTIGRADTQKHEVYRDSESSSEADDTTVRADTQSREVYRDSELPATGAKVYRDAESDDDTAARHGAQNRVDNRESEAKSAVGNGTTTLDIKPKTAVYRDSGSSSETDDDCFTPGGSRSHGVRPDF